MTAIITTLLQFAGKLIGWFRSHIDAAAEAEIAKHAVAVLRMTQVGKALLDKVGEMTDDELDDFLKDLGKD